MKASPIPLFPALGALALVGFTACSHSHRRSSYSVTVYSESEPNDFVDEANDFGLLFPDEFFIIEGDIYDDGLYVDAFDGFAFRSSDPLIVAFELFLDDPYADVRVGLYDPAIDETVAYWYEVNGYVYGELEVYDANTDFHLFVEHLSGGSFYELEIESFDYFFASADTGRAPEALGVKGLRKLTPRGVGGLNAEEREAAKAYSTKDAAAAHELDEIVDPIAGRATLFEIDPETGSVSHEAFLFTAGGSWMGIPGTALAE